MNLGNLHVRQGIDQLGVIQSVVRPAGLENLSLLLHGEVRISIVRVHVLLVEVEHFIVGDGSRVAEVVDASQFALCGT